jgi:hypothetical protein
VVYAVDRVLKRGRGAAGAASGGGVLLEVLASPFAAGLIEEKGQNGARVQGERIGTTHGCRCHLEAPKSALHTVGICEGRRGIPRQPGGDLAGDQRGRREGGGSYL